jgi:hypothetical protein
VENEESIYQRLVDQGYTEDQIQQILSLAGLEGDQARLGEQLDLAKALRKPGAPEGRQAGNVYVASNPLEHIGDVGQYYRGNQGVSNVYGEQKRIQDEQMKRRMEYLKAGGPKVTPTPPTYGPQGWVS